MRNLVGKTSSCPIVEQVKKVLVPLFNRPKILVPLLSMSKKRSCSFMQQTKNILVPICSRVCKKNWSPYYLLLTIPSSNTIHIMTNAILAIKPVIRTDQNILNDIRNQIRHQVGVFLACPKLDFLGISDLKISCVMLACYTNFNCMDFEKG